MGMYATKSMAERSPSIDTKWLKDHGYFCGRKSGGITWTSYFGDNPSISFTVYTMDHYPHIHFQYSTNEWGEEKKDMDYSFPLVQVPCNLGGFRWAFKCDLSKNGGYCGRIVHALYKAGSNYFGCRHCMSIVYRSQRKSGGRFEYFGKILDRAEEVEKLCNSIKKWSYKGRPTKKALRLKRLESILPSDQEMLDSELSLLKGRR